ncbi:unnamed protein product [Orchesella dallaii]|uniref:Death domain-containing protein n=1 Tax=Orchesella dallaii TaxID=48710 RepID=A0ABP1REQ2_9HEXA
MEASEQELIRRNRASLMQQTSCTGLLLANLDNLLSPEETAILKNLHEKNPFDASCRLYDIAITRVGGFEILKFALKNSNQTGALKILENGENPPNPSGVAQTNNQVTPSTNPDWKNLVVGSEQCKVAEVEKCLSNSASASVLWERLPDVGRTLDYPESDMIVTQVMMGIKTRSQFLVAILKNWHANEDMKATLGKLDQVLRDHKLNECAGALARTFQARPLK